MSGGIIRCDLKRDIEGENSFLVHAKAGKGDSLVEKRKRIIGDCLKNAIEGSDCLKVSAEFDQG